ncbi:MAG: cadherin-like beta sandwich domain-containing protein [Bacteroidota bacterium]|nr:cadherin-like beta sandwich domain-containing protein [Bacteroidota bacterium]
MKLFLLVSLILLGWPVFGQNTYYVSPSGTDDVNSGSSASPFKTIAYAATRVIAGDVVLVKAGTYAETTDIRPVSGTANQMIIFKPDAGAEGQVILSSGRFNLDSRNYIWVEGFRFEGYTVTAEVINLNKGSRNVVLNNRFKSITCANVIQLRESLDNAIRNNSFESITGDMIKVNARSFRNLITENTLINSNGIGIACSETYVERGTQVDGDNVFAFNYISGLNGNGIWFDRNGSGNVLLRNEAYNSNCLFFNESRCVRNWLYENIGVGNGIGIESANFNTGHTANARYINNVLYNCNTSILMDKSWYDEVRNNIVYKTSASGVCMRFTATAKSQGPQIFKNNLWFQDGKDNTFNYLGADVNYSVFAPGVNETGGLTVNPNFTNAGSNDFTLQSTSPAKGAGTNGKDLGAYPVYSKTAVGYVAPQSTTGNVTVGFGSNISPSGSVSLFAQRGQTQTITVNLSKAATGSVSVDIVPVAGDAVEGVDYTIVGGKTVTFAAGETSKTIQISIIGASQYEQIIAFRLANAVNASIGAMNLHVVRVGRTVYAGDDQLLILADGSVTKTIQFNGAIYGVTGSSYEWYDGTDLLATGLSATVNLPKGIHKITLEVTTPNGVFSDYLLVTIVKNADIWLEAESGIVGSDWDIISTDANASAGKYVARKTSIATPSEAPAGPNGYIVYKVNVKEEGFYRLNIRLKSESSEGVTFYSSFDGAELKDWNVGTTSGWEWKELSNAYLLTPGTHTFTLAYRTGLIDKILITNSGTIPSGVGVAANNCNGTLGDLSVSKGTLTPVFNPEVTNYTVTVPNDVTDIQLNATPNAGTTVTGGGAKQLALGVNTFNINVTSQYTPRTYTVTVMRLNVTYKPTNVVVDFNSNNLGYAYPLFTLNTSHEYMAEVVADPAPDQLAGVARGQVLNVRRILNATSTNNAFPVFEIRLPQGKTLGDCQKVVFNMRACLTTGIAGAGMRMTIRNAGDGTNVGAAIGSRTGLTSYPAANQSISENTWGTITHLFSTMSLTAEEKALNSFQLVLGSATGSGNYFMDNITVDFEKSVVQNVFNNDATLSALSVPSGTLTPAFTPNVTDYTVTIAPNTTAITLNAAANSAQAVVSGNGDKQLNAGNNIFYINVFAEDGTTKTYTVTVSDLTTDIPETDVNKGSILSVYPNPVKDIANIMLANPKVWVSLYDIFGRRLLTFVANKNAFTIDMSHYASGIYFLQVSDGIQKISKKIFKK